LQAQFILFFIFFKSDFLIACQVIKQSAADRLHLVYITCLTNESVCGSVVVEFK